MIDCCGAILINAYESDPLYGINNTVHTAYVIRDCHNHSMTEAVRHLWRPPAAALVKQGGHTEPTAQDHSQMAFEDGNSTNQSG